MRIAVLASGEGTNLQALLNAQAAGTLLPAEIGLVVSNRPDSAALRRATQASVTAKLVDHTAFASKQAFEEAILYQLDEHRIDAIVLAGFMRILGITLLKRFPEKILNTHPALCPSFPGLHAPQQAIDAGVKVTGCTVHFVDEGVDTGPIVFQETVPVLDGDTADSLHRRIREHEHDLLPKATQLMASGKLVCHGRRVHVGGK